MLSKELPLDCVLRLWDTYFSCDEGFGLHIYTMLAILVHFHEDLMELEHSEIKGFLQHLPEMDIDQVFCFFFFFAQHYPSFLLVGLLNAYHEILRPADNSTSIQHPRGSCPERAALKRLSPVSLFRK